MTPTFFPLKYHYREGSQRLLLKFFVCRPHMRHGGYLWPILYIYNVGHKYVLRLNGSLQEKTVAIVIETLPYDDNIGPKKLGSLLIIFSEN